MILIADSGSTKTDWRLIDNKNISVLTDGLNPFYIGLGDMTHIIATAFSEVNKEKVTHVFFYGAGCANEEKCNAVKTAIQIVFAKSKITVESDMLGTARSIFGTTTGIAAILGTGSNTCLFDGTKITQNIPSLGFILGDEGSGSYLGKKFLTAFLRKELSDNISQKFETKYNLSYSDILDAIYKKPFPNRWLAQFSVFLKENESQFEINKILNDSLSAFFENQLCRYADIQEQTVGLTGSIAYHFSDIIYNIASVKHIKIKTISKSPMDGLEDFHMHSQL